MKTTERTIEVGRYVDEHGKPAAAIHFGLSAETVKRYYTAYQQHIGTVNERDAKNVTIKRILDRFSPKELKALADGKSINPEQQEHPIIDFDGEEFKVLYVTDTHWGSKYSPRHYWESALEEAYKQGCSDIFHSGDLVEGMSNRPDQIYSLDHIGFSAQMDYAEEMLSVTDLPITIIDGNHDRWGIKSGGIFAVKDVAKRLDHVTYLGHDEGDITINGTVWRLWHGEDGSSYATSYRLQKVIEAFTGGDKPNVLLTGHTHKQGYFFDRNIHVVSGGALCRQSAWMRSKRLANHAGFHVIRATIADNEIKSFSPTWYPFYR